MPSTRFDETRDYGFADQVLVLRERAGLTQRAMAALPGVSGRAIQAWEAGLSYPEAKHLTQLITLYVERGAFPVGREEDAAAALWEAVRAHAPRRTVPFDRSWFASLQGGAGPAGPAGPHPLAAGTGAPWRDDWGEAPGAGAFYGRAQEVATLSRWLLADRCRLIALLGMGGIGKSILVAWLAREAAAQFAVVYWRSLRNAPPVEEWLAGASAALSAAQALPPQGHAARASAGVAARAPRPADAGQPGDHPGAGRTRGVLPGGLLVASGSEDGTVKLWNAASGRLLATLHGHMGGVYGVTLSQDGQLVARGSLDGTVKLWDAPSGQLRATLQGHTGTVYGVALSGDRQLAASSSEDGTVKLWEAGSGRLVATMQGQAPGSRVWR
jgi:transcriptional regulator with XRE-family HTH domain